VISVYFVKTLIFMDFIIFYNKFKFLQKEIPVTSNQYHYVICHLGYQQTKVIKVIKKILNRKTTKDFDNKMIKLHNTCMCLNEDL